MSELVNVDARYLSDIRDIVASYGRTFPADLIFCEALLQQLKNGDDFEICSRANMKGHLTASALLLNLEKTHAFLIYHKFLQRWLQAGGHVDAMESLPAAAARELREESGIQDFVVDKWHSENPIPLDIDSHSIPANQSKNEGAHFHHDFLYVFIFDKIIFDPHSDTTLKLQLEEVTDCKWFSLKELSTGQYGKRIARAALKLLSTT